jgi:hypothetical protein
VRLIVAINNKQNLLRQFLCRHNTHTEGVFVTQLSGNARGDQFDEMFELRHISLICDKGRNSKFAIFFQQKHEAGINLTKCLGYDIYRSFVTRVTTQNL